MKGNGSIKLSFILFQIEVAIMDGYYLWILLLEYTGTWSPGTPSKNLEIFLYFHLFRILFL